MSDLSFGQPSPSDVTQPSNTPMETSIDLMHYYRLILRNLWKIILFDID